MRLSTVYVKVAFPKTTPLRFIKWRKEYGKKSKIAKVKNNKLRFERYAALRQELKANKDYEGLRQLPLDASSGTLKNRDLIDGRPRGYMRKFGMSRIKFRELAHHGLIPGVKKQVGKPILQ